MATAKAHQGPLGHLAPCPDLGYEGHSRGQPTFAGPYGNACSWQAMETLSLANETLSLLNETLSLTNALSFKQASLQLELAETA